MSIPPHTKLFTEVDRTSDPDFFVRFMDEAQKPAAIQTSKQLMLEHLKVAPGEAILEVGCGPGTDLFGLAELNPQWLDRPPTASPVQGATPGCPFV